MSTTTTLLRQLEAYVQEEIGGQSRLLALLETQEAALRGRNQGELASATRALDSEIESALRRGQRRREIVAVLASQWGIAESALTLSSIVRRTGDEGDRLSRQKDELERVSREVQGLARRAGVAARFQQRLESELLQAVLSPAGASPLGGPLGGALHEGGALVDAEA
jgi:hypothetical protein